MEQKESLVEFTQKWLEEYGKIVSAYSHASVDAILSATVKIPTAIDLLSALQEREVRVLAKDQTWPHYSPMSDRVSSYFAGSGILEAKQAGYEAGQSAGRRVGFARVEPLLPEEKPKRRLSETMDELRKLAGPYYKDWGEKSGG